MPRKLFLVTFAVFVLALSACNNVRIEDGNLSIDITVSEATLNTIAERANNEANAGTSDDVLFDQVTRVEMIEPDIIRVFGEAEVDGVVRSGSYDVQIGAASGALRLAIVDVDMEGVTLDDPRLAAANAKLQEAFADQLRSEGGEGPISGARIEDGALKLEIDAPLN